MYKQIRCDDARHAPYGLRWQVGRETAFAPKGRTIPTTSDVWKSVLLNRLSPFTSHLSLQRNGGRGKNLKSPPKRAILRQSAPNSATFNSISTANIPKPPNTATKMARFGGLESDGVSAAECTRFSPVTSSFSSSMVHAEKSQTVHHFALFAQFCTTAHHFLRSFAPFGGSCTILHHKRCAPWCTWRISLFGSFRED